jgi:hypothetical protein
MPIRLAPMEAVGNAALPTWSDKPLAMRTKQC